MTEHQTNALEKAHGELPQWLTLPVLASHLQHQYERMAMLKTLVQLAIDALPNTTDSDEPLALLHGIKEILDADSTRAGALCEALESKITHSPPK